MNEIREILKTAPKEVLIEFIIERSVNYEFYNENAVRKLKKKLKEIKIGLKKQDLMKNCDNTYAEYQDTYKEWHDYLENIKLKYGTLKNASREEEIKYFKLLSKLNEASKKNDKAEEKMDAFLEKRFKK